MGIHNKIFKIGKVFVIKHGIRLFHFKYGKFNFVASLLHTLMKHLTNLHKLFVIIDFFSRLLLTVLLMCALCFADYCVYTPIKRPNTAGLVKCPSVKHILSVKGLS